MTEITGVIFWSVLVAVGSVLIGIIEARRASRRKECLKHGHQWTEIEEYSVYGLVCSNCKTRPHRR